MMQNRSVCIGFLAFALCGAACIPAFSNEVSGLAIESKSVVFDYGNADPFDRGNLYGFNHAASIARLPDGTLLAAWFSGPYEGSVHQVIYGCRSRDNGKTWGKGEVLQDDPHKSDFDPAFIVNGSRTWLFFSTGRWDRYPFAVQRPGEDPHIGAESFKIFGRHSDDSGKTWSEPARVFDSVGWGCRSNGIVLSTGELILPTHEFTTWKAAALRSEDGGATWTRSPEIVAPDNAGSAEPSIAELRNGNLLMAVRSRDGELRSCISKDKGKTWPAPAKIGIPAGNSSNNILGLRDGRLLLTYNSVPPDRTHLSMRRSIDDGNTWGPPLLLAETEAATDADRFWSKQVCYPSAVELPDGAIIVVWADLELSGEWQPGVIRAARILVD